VSLAATIHHFAVRLSDVDRGVYETLALKVARHPSEAADHLVTRVVAYCLELTGLHKASKAAPRVAVYTHKPPAQLLRQLEGERIHRAAEIELYALDRELVSGLAARLERRMELDVSVTDRHLFISMGGATLSGAVERLLLAV
jgi:uncharacterized protein YaeQ